MMNEQTKRDLKTLAGPYLALAVLLIICCISNEHFRSVRNLLNITRQVSYSGFIALGMTFVIGAGGIDLSVGSLLALSGVLSILGMNALPEAYPGLAVLAAAGIAVGTGLLGGVINGLLVSVGKIPPFIATLGTLSIYRSLALYFANAGLVTSANPVFRSVGALTVGPVPLPTLILTVVMIILAAVLSKTRFGRYTCAVGSNERVAKFSAIHIGFIKFMTYALIGFLTGMSAFQFGGRLSAVSSTSAGLSYELDAIAAVIIGGTSMAGGKATVVGTFAGILILGIVSNVLDMWGISVNLQGLVKGLVIIIAVLIQRFKFRKG